MKRGSRKYRCAECAATSMHHWVERNRAARLRCPACGSARMELASADAKADAAAAQAVRLDGGTRSTTPPRDDPRRKVT